ncbi:MAG: hypothetical protein Q7S33_01820 [Nanoarchaeota archaeon]|nr:hypothetical protein [Nanoarchaeota archaeon]
MSLTNLKLYARTDFSSCPYHNSNKCYANDNKECYREKNNLSYENCHLRQINLSSLEIIARYLAS